MYTVASLDHHQPFFFCKCDLEKARGSNSNSGVWGELHRGGKLLPVDKNTNPIYTHTTGYEAHFTVKMYTVISNTVYNIRENTLKQVIFFPFITGF